MSTRATTTITHRGGRICLGKLSALLDLDVFEGAVLIALWHGLDVLDDVHSGQNAAEDDVLAVEPGCLDGCVETERVRARLSM